MRNSFPIQEVRRSVERLMLEKGDKAKPLAEKLGISETGIRDIFLPKTKSVNGPKLAAIASYYGVSVEEILSGEATTVSNKKKEALEWSLVNAETLEPILAQCLRLAPPGGWSELDAPLLARSVEYGLRFLATAPATQSIGDSLAVAGHAATLRLRELRHEA